MTEHPFREKTCLITGGTRGIGKATALRLANEGARVALNFFGRADDAQQTLGEIHESGGEAIAIQGDVSQPDDAARIVSQAREFLGTIDWLVHSAGLSIVEPASDVTWETWKKTMDVNLDGTFNMVYAVKDAMSSTVPWRCMGISGK